MAPKKDILQELNDIAPGLANIGTAMPYNVPAGYFDELPGLILMRIKTMHATPGEELQMLSPLLGGLKKEMPFKVPEGYFESLTPAQLKKETPVRSISFGKRIFRYAAAAVVAGLVATTVWFTLNKPATKNTVAMTTVDSVSSKDLSNISDSEMESFLDGNITITYESSNSSNDIKAEDIKLMLAEVPDKELENYLN